MIRTGSDFSGVGAFDQALDRLGIKQDKKFACDMDKYARRTYTYNFGTTADHELSYLPFEGVKPKHFSFYYPTNVYNREIPEESLDIYMTSPPCQSFSLAGKRKGEDSENGILFYNSHEFIVKNKPRYFIFENVKGLLSDNSGKTFQTWCDYLGGKTVNGNPVIFPHDESVPYHIYHKVLNAKHYNIPQNRERVFIIGIRDDDDNVFRWPKPVHLEKRLKDVLESEVDEKYFLSDNMIKGFIKSTKKHEEKGTGFVWQPKTENDTANCLRANGALCKTDNSIEIKSATKKGYEVATENDSINLTFPNSETRRGRVGVGQTLDTACNQGVIVNVDNDIKNPLKGKTEFGWHFEQNVYAEESKCTRTVMAGQGSGSRAKIIHETKIRRLTPLECFRLMDFNESFKWNVSDTQAYKQAGNSIAVGVLAGIINNLKL